MDYLTGLVIAKLTKTDPPRRNEARCKVRISTFTDSMVVAGVCLTVPEAAPSEQLSPHLVAREIAAEVYEEDLPDLLALVEPRLSKADIDRVEEHYEAELAIWSEPLLKGKENKAQAQADAERSFPGSYPGFWRRVFPKERRDMKPFASVTRIEEKKTKAA